MARAVAPRPQGAVGAHSACAGRGPREGLSREDNWSLRAHAGPLPSPGCSPRGADSTPPAALKGAAGRGTHTLGWQMPGPPGDSPSPTFARRPLSGQLQNLGALRLQCPPGPVIVHITSNTGHDFRDIFVNFITTGREEGRFMKGLEDAALLS